MSAIFNLFGELARRVKMLFRREKFGRELEEEMRLHRELRERDARDGGASPDEARFAAQRQFGNEMLIHDHARDAWGFLWLTQFLQDLRYGLRSLAKSPGFSVVAILTLALGIGANTAIFSVVNAVVLRPLPYIEADRLVRIWESNLRRGLATYPASSPNFEDWRKQEQVFSHVAAYEMTTFNLTEGGEPERVVAATVTANLFPALGAAPALGRDFLPEEERAGHNRVVLVSQGLWQRRFGADRELIGKTIQLSGESYVVLGVMPADFQFVRGIDVWVPLVLDAAVIPWRADRANRNFQVVGRLKDGVSLAQAQANMDAMARELEQQYPAANAGWGIRLQTFYEWIVPGEVRRGFWVLLGAVGFVLLIACANVANLLLARAAGRRREVAIRSAMGASGGRLARQFLTESFLLTWLGGVTGLLLAVWGVRALVNYFPRNLPRIEEVGIDFRVLGFAFAISFAATVIFGFFPALQASRVSLSEAFQEGARGVLGGVRHRARNVLTVAEIALAFVLLIGAALMAQSFARLTNVPLGFQPENVLTLQTNLPGSRYGEGRQKTAFYERALGGIRALPGVTGAAAVVGIPLTPVNWSTQIFIEGRTAAAGETLSADARAVTPQYFRTLGIPILQGRDFTERDGPDSAAIVISEAMARRYWPNEDAVGKRFRAGANSPWKTIVGVVGDVCVSLERTAAPTFYYSAAQFGFGAMTIVVRTTGNPDGWATAVRRAIAAEDAALPAYNVRPMSEIVAQAAGQPRFRAALVGLFAVSAFVLAVVGVYGVMSFLVTGAISEIGIRMALGAQRGDVLRLVIARGMKPVAMGLGLGLVGAFLSGRAIASLLFGIQPTDPLTVVVATVTLAGAALLACWIPARRAARVDPMVALRHD